jgi:hypothetical protein
MKIIIVDSDSLRKVEVEARQSDDSFLYEHKWLCSLGRNLAESSRNVTFFIRQALLFVSDSTMFRYCRQANIFMPPGYDWSFIRDATAQQKTELAYCLVNNRKVREGLQGTFCETIARNVGIWPIERRERQEG